MDRVFSRGTDRTILTGRELEVVRLISEGWNNKVIARTLSVKETTIERHINTIYEKISALYDTKDRNLRCYLSSLYREDKI